VTRSLLVGLAALAGCYNPKADIEANRPAAEKKLAAMERIGRTVAALPALGADTMRFPNPSELRFDDNAVIVHLEELSDIGGSHIYDRIVDEEFFKPAAVLLKEGRDPNIQKLNKSVVDFEFKKLVGKDYLVVLRTASHVQAKMTGKDEFAAGDVRGEAFLCEIKTGEQCFGGFGWSAASSGSVTAQLHGDAERRQIQKSLAVREDIDKQARQAIHDKLKAALPGARFPSYY
jgi:hypothetical protein